MGKLSGKVVANMLFIKSGKKTIKAPAYRETFSAQKTGTDNTEKQNDAETLYYQVDALRYTNLEADLEAQLRDQ
jgi:hypothetical protein